MTGISWHAADGRMYWTLFYEGILRGTQYGNHPRTKYALKIHRIIEELMNKDWNKVNETLK